MPRYPSRNKTLAIAARHYGETDIKSFLFHSFHFWFFGFLIWFIG